ncbi:MAG: ArdC family protein [Ramlibacter sp.]
MATTEKERGADEKGARGQSAGADAKFDVKSHVAQTLIDAIERGETPWQKPWNSVSLRPMNPTSGNPYRGINRVLLSLAGRGDGRWVTFQQAQAKGWRIRRGEKGSMIVKVVELGDRRDAQANGAQDQAGRASQAEEQEQRRKPLALLRYFVFNAEQVEGMPPLEQTGDLEFDPVEKAEAVIAAMKEKTGLLIVHGGTKAFYNAALDEIRLPPKKKFATAYDLYATTLHEVCHSSMSPKRLDRKEAYAKRWGNEAYALEELTAEIGSAILSSELGIADQTSDAQREKHLANHAAYLQSWLKVLRADPLAIFTAAKAADRISEYVLGIERQATAMEQHKEWIAEYEAAPTR